MSAPDRLRVVLVLAGSTGGIGRHVRTLAGELLARGHTVTVVGPLETESAFAFSAAGAAFAPAGVGSASPLALRAVRQVLRGAARHADVVHAHGVRATVTAAAAGVGPLVSTWHNAPLGGAGHRAVHALLERRAARGADATLGASDDLVARARRAGATGAVFVPVVAAPLPAAARPAEAVRVELGVGERPVVLAVARLHPQKRLDLLVEATRGWADDPGGPAVVVAGEGPARPALEQAAAAARSPVRLLGARTDVADLLSAADVAVLPSEWEARPLYAQEALRAGVPLVATAVGGVPGLVGDAAVLVPAGGAAPLRAALTRLLGDPDLRASLAAAGRRQAATWPTVPEMVDEIIDIYLDVKSRARA